MNIYTALVLLAGLSAALYVFFAICLRRISMDTGIGKPWHGWVPFLNVYLACRLAGKRYIWTALVFVPIVNIVIIVLLSVKIARLKGRGRIYGVFMAIPGPDLPLLWLLSFRDTAAHGGKA